MISYADVAQAIKRKAFVYADHALKRRVERSINLYALVRSIASKSYPSYRGHHGALVVCINEGANYHVVWGERSGTVVLVTVLIYNALMGLSASNGDYTNRLGDFFGKAA